MRGAQAQDEAREDGRAGVVLDTGPRDAQLVSTNVEDAEPYAKLVDQIQVGPGRQALALGVVLAFDDVEGQRALIAGDAVRTVEVEEAVAGA